MKRILIFAVVILVAVPFLLMAEKPKEEGAPQKIIAIGDVDVGYDVSGRRAYDVKETIQLGLKKEIEKIGKGKYVINITSPAVVSEDKEPEASDFPELPTNRAPTQKEISKYMAAMQQWQKEMTGQVKKHKSIAADAYFEFNIVSGKSGFDTSSAASMVEDFAGVNTTPGNISTKTTKLHLIATMRDPKTGSLIDKHTAEASSVKFRNVGGYTSYDYYGDDGTTRERLFSSAIKNCAKWITQQVQ